MEQNSNRYFIRLNGPFSIVDENGSDQTLLGDKECALIALLATGDGYERSRKWIKSLLWSDSEAEKASSNLRQTLWRVRRHFSKNCRLLDSNNSKIWLKKESVVVLWNKNKSHDFMEGLDVVDEVFEEWLLETRHSAATFYLSPKQQPSLLICIADSPHPDDGEALYEYLKTRLEEWGVTSARLKRSSSFQNNNISNLANARILNVKFCPNEYLIAKLDTRNSEDSWSFVWPLSSGKFGQLRSCFDGIDMFIADLILKLQTLHLSPLSKAINLFFANTEPAFKCAQKTFSELSHETGVAEAWYAYSLVMANAEKIKGNKFCEYDRVVAHLRGAIEKDPTNASVNALVGHIYSFLLRDFQKAEGYLTQARRIHPSSKLVSTFSAITANYSDNSKKAEDYITSAYNNQGLNAFDFMLDTSRLTSLTHRGNFEAATRLGEGILLEKPSFLGVKRQLTACYHQLGDYEKRDETIIDIRHSDADFTAEGIRSKTYPIASETSKDLIFESLKASKVSNYSISEV